ncbi:MAG: arsenic transporter, partial [Candidatus Dormiibacterota bacterium]
AAIRALLGGGVLIRGGRSVQLFAAALLAAGIDNLPAAAAIRTAGAGVPWPAVLGLAVGPNLVVTGSLATLISRRIARDAGSGFAVGWFTRMGWLLVPAQLLIAVAGLRLSGAV